MNLPDNKTVLMVAGEFSPVKTIGRLRTLKFIEHLRAHGWDAVVLTIEPNGTSSVADPELIHEIPDDLVVYRVTHPNVEASVADFVKLLIGRGQGKQSGRDIAPAVVAPTRSSPLDWMHDLFKKILTNYIYVPDSYNLWAWKARRTAARICAEHNIDLVYTTLPPFSGAFIGDYLKRRTGLPWVVDYRDLWAGDVLREWLAPSRQRLERWLERKLSRSADAIVAVSAPKLAYLRQLHEPSRAQFVTLTNGYDREEFADVQRERSFPEDEIHFVFTGRLFKNRRGHAFAEALGQLSEEQPQLARKARVHFLGDVTTEHYDIADQFDFAGDVPHMTAKQAQVNADYLLLIVDTGGTSNGVIPGKLFEYVAARRPIFALTDPGATADIITKGRLGLVVSVNDVAACKVALEKVLASTVPQRLNADESYLSQFDRRVITAQLAELFDELSSAHGS
jgi:glycosyltransferase involved in cell wall biosynthesis